MSEIKATENINFKSATVVLEIFAGIKYYVSLTWPVYVVVDDMPRSYSPPSYSL